MTSIYEAEIRKKPGPQMTEDQLTSRVFGALEILPKNQVLVPFIKKIITDSPSGKPDCVDLLTAINTLRDDINLQPIIELWKNAGGKYPDVHINIRYLAFRIMIEIKKNMDPTAEQIYEQYIRSKPDAYFLLTNDDSEPEAVRIARVTLKNIPELADVKVYWRRWPQVWKWLNQILKEQNLDHTSINLMNSTIKLLEVENMKEPTGMKKEWFSTPVVENLKIIRDLCNEISITIRKVNEELDKKGLTQLKVNKSTAPFERAVSTNLDGPDNWIPETFDFCYKDKKWRRINKIFDQPCLYISFDLRDGFEGVKTGIWWNKPSKEQIIEIRGKLKLKRNQGKEFDETYLNTDNGLDVHQNINIDNLLNENIVLVLVEKTTEMRNFMESLESVRSKLGLRISSKAKISKQI